MKSKRSCIIVGAGHRAQVYAAYAKSHPDEMEGVGVADPSDLRRQEKSRTFGLDASQCFTSAEALAEKPRMADFVINGTMDHQHVPTSLSLLERGYDLLLEKAFATNQEEMWQMKVTGDMTGTHGGHGGGGERLVADFLCVLNGESPSISSTGIEDSVSGHLIGFRANQSVEENRVVDIEMNGP